MLRPILYITTQYTRKMKPSSEYESASKRTEKILNLLVAFSTSVVLLLAWDHTGSMLTTYKALEPETTVQVLQKKCSDVWKSHRQNNTGASVTEWSKPKPKYNLPGFCARLPADVSPAHLWNKHLDWILEASSNDEDISSHLLTSKLLQFLSPSKYLHLGLRSRPSQEAWGRVLEKIEARMKSDKAPMVHVAAFGVGGSTCEQFSGDSERMGPMPEPDIDCLWPVRLEAFLNNILNHDRPPQEKRAIVNITPMYHSDIAVTTDYDTAIVKHGLWLDHLKAHGGPDVIINAYNAQDMFPPKRDWKTATDIEYYHQQRRIVQDFIRACIGHRPCSFDNGNSLIKPPPLVINIDDYVGNQQGPVMAETTQGRVLQLLSDYYELSFVSYAEVIRRLVYASDFSSLKHINLKEWTSDWAALGGEENSQGTIEHGMVGPIALTMTIAYSFLSYTVGHCTHQQRQTLDDFSLMPEHVFRLANEVTPPELNTDLCLNNVTDIWQTAKMEQEAHAEECKAGKDATLAKCSFAFSVGTHWARDTLESYMKPFLKESSGWEIQNGARIVALRAGATLGFSFPLQGLNEDADKVIRLFSIRQDQQVVEPSRLKWEISVQGTRRTRRRFLQQGSSTADMSGFINGTHDSPATVALPTNIPISSDFVSNGTSAVDLRLHLVEGEPFDIISLMFCDDP